MLTIYKASAGSGKTYALAKEYILQLVAYKDHAAPVKGKSRRRYKLRPPGQHAHRGILAVTFSIQATEEMKRRIVHELAKIADLKSASNYRSDFVREYGFDELALAKVAREAMQDLLFDFSMFNVSTIDSFFQSVLRSFAREIDLPGNYEIEIDEKLAVGIAVAEMFSSLNDPARHDRRLMSWITHYMENCIDEGAQFNMLNRNSAMHARLVDNLTSLFDEDYRSNAEAIHSYFDRESSRLAQFEQALAKRLSQLRKVFADNAVAAQNAITKYGLDTGQTVNSTIRGRIDRWAAGAPYDSSDARSSTLSCYLPDQVKKRYYATYLKGNTPPSEVDDAITYMLAQAPALNKDIKQTLIIRKNLYLFGLLGYVVDFIANYRRDNNTILISDTNELLKRIINDDLTPFIYERIGVFIRHFLIDEFQDTSRMQWDNFKPLLLESIGNDNDNLIIGDEKQCIYRFRNSDPNLLASQVKEQVEETLSPSAIAEQGQLRDQNTNRRSSPNVVRFNNTLFPQLAALLNAQAAYANTRQHIWEKFADTPGYVDVAMLEAARKEEFEAMTLDRLAGEVRRQLLAGYRPKDIAVIVRYHKEGELVINHLLSLMDGENPFFAQRFDITSREAMLISSSPLVKLIVSVLRVIDTPESSSSARNTSAMKLARLTNRFEYFYNRKNLDASQALLRALDDEGEIDTLTTDAVAMRFVNLHSIVEHIIGAFVARDQCDAHNIFLSAFQDQVVDFCARGQADVHSFLQWWDSRGRFVKLATPDDLDALTVITIHASKGLEYKCVHIPFATWQMCSPSMPRRQSFSWYTLPSLPGIPDDVIPAKMPLENVALLRETDLRQQFDRIMLEQKVDNLNLFYVANTRAAHELIITSYKPAKADESLGYYLGQALPQLVAADPEMTIDVNFDGNSAIVGAPLPPEGIKALHLKEQAKEADTPPTAPMPPYKSTLRHKVWSLTRIDDLCDINQSRERGTFLHSVLSNVRSRADLPLALRRRAHRVGLPPEQQQQFLQLLTKALADPRVDRWFDNTHRVLNERTIDLDSERRERPDRVVWTDQNTIEVIDYKFGKHSDKYKEQVRRYMRPLSQIFPDAEVKGFLWYPESSDILPITL